MCLEFFVLDDYVKCFLMTISITIIITEIIMEKIMISLICLTNEHNLNVWL